MAEQVTTTQRQDLPAWAQPFGYAMMNWLMPTLFPNVETKGYDKDGKPILELNDPVDYEKANGPLLPHLKDFNPLETFGHYGAVSQATDQIGMNKATNQWITDSLSRGAEGVADTPQDFARMDQMFNLAGPLAGATRTSLLDALMGRPQEAASQKYLDSMYGKGANAAENAAYNLLGPQRNLATDASTWNYAGPMAGAARSQSMKEITGQMLNDPLFGAAKQQQMNTINGRYMNPNSNPYLSANVDSALKAVSDNYRYATAPSTDAQFARAGSFGGSAHQQTKQMKQFELGRNLSDLANSMYGQNYAQERQNQLGAIQGERGQYAQERQNQIGATQGSLAQALQSLMSERQMQYGTQESALQRALQAAQDERSGWRQMTDNNATRLQQGSEAELNRALQLQSIMPELMKSQYLPYDAMRTIGAEYRNLGNQNNQIDYQNQLTKFQWPFNVYNILGAGLAQATGGQGVTTQTAPNANAANPWAQGLGGATLGVQALSGLGSALGYGSQPAPAPQKVN